MHDRVVQSLERIEREQNVRVLLAVESGSRAWGFSSTNSDWDVRFVYVREEDYYLSIDVENKRDVIELVEGDNLDVVGWDLRKALKLFAKSNPSIVEWLQSIQVYRPGLDNLRSMLPSNYSPTAGYWHYMSMARANKRNYLSGEGPVRLKKYLYVFRGLLSARWVGTYLSPPPLNFSLLLPMVGEEEGGVVSELGKLLSRKMSGEELTEGKRIELLDNFISKELESDDYRPKVDKFQPDWDKLNALFREEVRG